MSNARFYFTQNLGDPIHLSIEDSHYIRDVLRLRAGDHLELGDAESGILALTSIRELEPTVVVAIDAILQAAAETPPGPTLLCALLKGQKNDLICDWATELGCSRIIFWQSSRSIVRIDTEKDRLHKEARLNKIALAAAQQSKQLKPPTVRVTRSLTEALESIAAPSGSEELRLTCSLRPGAAPIRSLIATHPTTFRHVVAIGAEGDFSPDEEASLGAHGFVPASLGDRTLRSELAVVTALSCLTTA